MKAFLHYVKARTNLLKLGSYFKEFTQSSKYESFIAMLTSDIEIIMMQMNIFKDDIQYCSDEIKN